MNERIEWTNTETGQRYVTETGHHRIPGPLNGQPYEATRGVYPGEHAQIRQEAAPVPTPPPARVEVVTDLTGAPSSLRGAVKLALENGWEVKVTRSAGPRIDGGSGEAVGVSYVYGLRCDKPEQRVIMTWRWSAPTEKAEAKWSFDAAWIMPGLVLCRSKAARLALSDFIAGIDDISKRQREDIAIRSEV